MEETVYSETTNILRIPVAGLRSFCVGTRYSREGSNNYFLCAELDIDPKDLSDDLSEIPEEVEDQFFSFLGDGGSAEFYLDCLVDDDALITIDGWPTLWDGGTNGVSEALRMLEIDRVNGYAWLAMESVGLVLKALTMDAREDA